MTRNPLQLSTGNRRRIVSGLLQLAVIALAITTTLPFTQPTTGP